MILKQITSLLLLINSSLFAQGPAVSIISVSDFEKAIQENNLQLIDVRTPKEYSKGYIANAINFPIAARKKFKKSLNALNKNKPLYIYCHSGVRSRRAGKILQRLGFTKIYDFKGGWKAWSKR